MMYTLTQTVSRRCFQLRYYVEGVVTSLNSSQFLFTQPHVHSRLLGPPGMENVSHLHTSNISNHMRIYEPDYLQLLEPPTPVYPILDLQMKGYDFAVLERFQGLLHTLIEALGLNIRDGYALPPQCWKITKIVPKSSIPDAEYNLKTYQRVIQLSDVPSMRMGILIEMLQECTPPGVTCRLVEHTEEMEKERYVPDLELKELKKQLEEVEQSLRK